MSTSSQEREFEEHISNTEGNNAKLAELRSKAEIKEMEKLLGKTEVRELITSGAIKLAKRAYSEARHLHVNKGTSDKLFGDSSSLRAYNDPSNMRRPR